MFCSFGLWASNINGVAYAIQNKVLDTYRQFTVALLVQTSYISYYMTCKCWTINR